MRVKIFEYEIFKKQISVENYNSNLDSSLRAAISKYIVEFSKLAENQCQESLINFLFFAYY